jgi:uracil-DNA glycosylase
MAARQFKELFTREWHDLLLPILDSENFSKLAVKIAAERVTKRIYPASRDVFRAFNVCPLDDLKVVILGQDPYHDGSATGLAFCNKGKVIPSPSLKNILSEVKNQIYLSDGKHRDEGALSDMYFQQQAVYNDPSPHYLNDLTRWARQGILLLNTALTVEAGHPLSHTHFWQDFTTEVITLISSSKQHNLLKWRL